MGKIQASLLAILAISTVLILVGTSYAEIPQQAQERMNENAQEKISTRDNFGLEVSRFAHEAMAQFAQQRQETIDAIKQCRENMKQADSSERSQTRQECRDTLDEIRNSYKDIRDTFRETFKQFGADIRVLVKEARGEHAADSDVRGAVDRVNEKAHRMEAKSDEKGKISKIVSDISNNIQNKSETEENEVNGEPETPYVTVVDGVQIVTIHAKEFKFLPSEIHISHGKTKFAMVNDGGAEHEMVIYESSKKDIVDQAEIAEDEDTIAKNIIAEIEEVESGETGESEVIDLSTGSLVIGCHVPGHYEAGMKGTIDVS